MNSVGDLLVGLVVLVGLFGVVVQVLPGGLLVAGAIIVWGVVTGGAAGWTVVATLVILGVRKPSRVTTGYLGAIAGLTALNVAIAVLWR